MAKKTQKNELTEMVFILDRSGSMCGLESDTIGGFNSLIEKQKKQEGDCFVTTVLFSDTMQTVHDRCKLEAVEKMTDKDYQTMGCTALYDAIGRTLTHIASIHKYARKEDVPAHTIVVIITDGYENASREYSHAAVKRLIEQKKEEAGWEFLFIGANIDAAATAENIGIGRERAANYKADKAGTAVVFEALSAPLCACRASRPLDESWSEAIEEDCKKR
ncbi:MAG: VWA domain-containing protein [Ruminococcaceae bacterium]|nr:VWA domain-containing protein [Oscillospiraceae bacterium]